jgi:hypothetical protein
VDLLTLTSHIQQPKRRRRLIDIAEFAPKEGVGIVRAGMCQHLRNVISIGHWMRQVSAAPLNTHLHLVEHDLERLVIANQMMELKQAIPMFTIWMLADLQPREWGFR